MKNYCDNVSVKNVLLTPKTLMVMIKKSDLKQELPYKRSLDPKISTGRAAVLD